MVVRIVMKAMIRRSAFSRNPFSRNRNDIETGSHQSGSTTASFIAPVNVGEQFQNVQNELVDVTTKNAGLEFYACFIENGVILLPRTNHQFQRSDLIRKVQEQIVRSSKKSFLAWSLNKHRWKLFSRASAAARGISLSEPGPRCPL